MHVSKFSWFQMVIRRKRFNYPCIMLINQVLYFHTADNRVVTFPGYFLLWGPDPATPWSVAQQVQMSHEQVSWNRTSLSSPTRSDPTSFTVITQIADSRTVTFSAYSLLWAPVPASLTGLRASCGGVSSSGQYKSFKLSQIRSGSTDAKLLKVVIAIYNKNTRRQNIALAIKY